MLEEEEEEEEDDDGDGDDDDDDDMASEFSPAALPSVFFSQPKKGHSAPDVTWACAWYLV